MVAEYRIEYAPRPDTSFYPIAQSPTSGFLCPFHRKIYIDHFTSYKPEPHAIGKPPMMPGPQH